MFIFSILFLLVFASFAWFFTIVGIIKLLFKAIYASIISIYNYFYVTKPMIKDNFLQQKELEQMILDEEKKIAQQKKVLAQNNLIINSSLSKVRELRIRFPYASEDLFTYYLKKYASYSVDELLQIEDMIKTSHLENGHNINLENQKHYNLNDLVNTNPISILKEDQVEMKIYKISNDYVVHIKNKELSYDKLYQSRDYLTIYKIALKLKQDIQKLRNYNNSITATNVDRVAREIINLKNREIGDNNAL